MHFTSIETERLCIRRLTAADLDFYNRVYIEIGWAEDNAQTLEWHRGLVNWTIANYDALASMNQPPYGDYAIVRQADAVPVGLVGYVPSFAPLDQLWTAQPAANETAFGLFWAIRPAFQGHGYATEAARTLIGHAFTHLNLKQIIATTTYDNAASQAVMRRLGMTIYRNQIDQPEWFQVAGILTNGDTNHHAQ